MSSPPITDDDLRQIERTAHERRRALTEKAKRDGGCYDPVYKRWIKWNGDGPDPEDWAAAKAEYNKKQQEERDDWYRQLARHLIPKGEEWGFAWGCYAFFCESPIEFRFFVEAGRQRWWLRPQLQVDQYRLDLADEERKIAIELDGHDYHKTKQQRGHDAKRDRRLTELGWKVLRFTGSEVHADVGQCVREARKTAGVSDAKQPT